MSVFAFGRQCRNRSNDIYDRSARGTDEFDLLSYSQCNKPRFSLVYARLRGVVGQVLPRKRGRHHVENWSVDTNLRPLFGHSPLFCLLDAYCDALFLFALKTVHRRSRSRAQGNIDSWRFSESRSWIGFSFHFKAVLQNFSLFDPRSVIKMIFCM